MRSILTLIIIICCALLSPELLAGTSRLELKGLSPGMHRDSIDEKYPDLCWSPEKGQKLLNCDTSGRDASKIQDFWTIAEQPVIGWVFSFSDDILGEILIPFKTEHFDKIKDAMIAKFGKPKAAKGRVLQNKMGANFQQIELTWIASGKILHLAKHATSVENGYLSLTSSQYLAKKAKIDSEETTKHAKDM